MKALLTKSSALLIDCTNVVEVNTIEDLLNLDEDNDGLIIWKKGLAFDLKEHPEIDADFEVEIYDTYRE